MSSSALGSVAARREFNGRGSTIGDVSSLFELTPRAIRHYEERGLIAPRRNGRNQRVFDGATRRRLKVIAELRRAGLPLWEIDGLLAGADDDEALLWRRVGQSLRARLEALDLARQRLTAAIADLP